MNIAFTKIAPQLIYPLNASLALLLVAFFLFCIKRFRTAYTLMFFAISLLWICSTPKFADALLAKLEQQYPPQPIDSFERADAIVILGGSIGLPLAPRILPDLGSAADRVVYGAQLYLADKSDRIIISGGNVFPQASDSEAEHTKVFLKLLGVNDEAIIIESTSRNTYENALYTAQLLKEQNLGNNILLVTSASHMPRAIATFRSAGINATPATTDINIISYQQPVLLEWIPSAGAISQTTNAMKEYLGYWLYSYKGWIIDSAIVR